MMYHGSKLFPKRENKTRRTREWNQTYDLDQSSLLQHQVYSQRHLRIVCELQHTSWSYPQWNATAGLRLQGLLLWCWSGVYSSRPCWILLWFFSQCCTRFVDPRVNIKSSKGMPNQFSVSAATTENVVRIMFRCAPCFGILLSVATMERSLKGEMLVRE